MSSLGGKLRSFVKRNIVIFVTVPSIAGLHWVWQKFQEDDRFVAEYERREFPPITLYRHAKYFLGLGPQPEKGHPPPPGGPRQ